MSDVLFEITKDHLETGLRGIPVGYCPTSYVDPQKGLFYVGNPLAELSFLEPQDVIYLLYSGKMGSKKEVNDFFDLLKTQTTCSQKVICHIKALPQTGHPMALFSAALLILGIFECKNDYREDCINLIAKLPHLVATLINYHAGWGETPPPSPHLGYMENFTYMLQVPGKKEVELTRILKLFNILHYDHGGGNLSTFVGKAVASGLEDMYGSIASAMCALAGPLHGRANQDSLSFVKEVLETVGAHATAKDVETYLRDRLAANKLVFGFGHAVLRVEDPRASTFYDFAKKYYSHDPMVKIALLLRTEGSKVLSENPKISDPHPNIDAISGVVLAAAGFHYPEYFTVLFGLSRSVGIAIQIVYERLEARGGKGTPIVRPKYLYKPRA
jgi:citrate synthase